MITRRKFITRSALATGGLLLSSTAFGRFLIGRKPHVIIIGAGLSGLAAAYYLKKKGISYTILESRSRVGGRVFSHHIDEDLVVELGGEWVGNSHQRMHEFCDEFDLELQNNQMESRLIYRGDYYEKNEWDYSKAWKDKYARLLEGYRNMPDEERGKLDGLDWWRYLVNNGCDGRDLDIKELFDSTDFGESIRHISAFCAIDEYYKSSPNNEMDKKIKGGNDMLAKTLHHKVGKDNVLLRHTVKRIVQADRVTVYCDDGIQFNGDLLICTIPTYAMKHIQWEPGLPDEKVNAINELQYARINKNPLLFSKRFWKDEAFDLVTDQTSHYFYHATKNQRSPKGVLISYSIGDKAAVVANQSKEWRADMVQQTLQPRFGDIKKLLIDQENYYWGNDRRSRGAYAIYGIGQWERVFDALTAPFLKTYFAGEHISENYQGFMEGAIGTGEAAARALADA